MQLTNRQLFILSYLINHRQRISGEHLASQAGISVRTLQSEIQKINLSLDNGVSIDSSSKQGYLVCGVTQTFRENLLAQVWDRQSLFMPEDRVNDILTILLFARDYTSMESLANTLYLSKASVFRSVESNLALRSAVTVSRTRGLIIDLPEYNKRQLLTKVFDKDAPNPIARALRQDYIQLDKLLRIALKNLFTNHSYSVSGEALRSFRRYLIITILRSKQGYPLEEIDHGLPISSLMQDITAAVRTIIGVTFSPSELQDCQVKLNNLCTFLRNTPAHRMDWLPRWTPHYDRFLSEIRQRYGVSLDMEPEDQRRFLLHVHKLYRRAVFGQHDSNYHKREINRTYPLAVHLVILAFEECFGFPVPETEVSYLAMYLAMKMRKHFKRIDCIIVTAKHPSVAWPMKQWMEEHFSRHLQSVEIVEHYRFTPAMVRNDMLVLTTGEDVVISCAQAILVKPFRLEQEYDLIDQYIQQIRSQYKENLFARSFARYSRGLETLDVRGKNLYELLEAMDILLRPGEQYEFVLDTDAFLLPRVHEGPGENTIRVCCLTHPVFHRGTDLRYLVISDYYTETAEMQDFYYCLKSLLRPGRLDSMKSENQPD